MLMIVQYIICMSVVLFLTCQKIMHCITSDGHTTDTSLSFRQKSEVQR